MKIKITVNLKINRWIKYLIFADLALLMGWGLIGPIFSIFVIEKVQGATLITVGAAASIYWILKSLLQLPIANFLDKKPGEKDDFYALIIGLFIASLAAFSFGLINKVWQLYLVQIIQAIGFALYVPSWSSLFSRHLDKERVSFDWSLDSTVAGLAAGVSGFLGGIAAKLFGFQSVFIAAAILTLASAFILLLAPELVLPRKTITDPLVQGRAPTDKKI